MLALGALVLMGIALAVLLRDPRARHGRSAGRVGVESAPTRTEREQGLAGSPEVEAVGLGSATGSRVAVPAHSGDLETAPGVKSRFASLHGRLRDPGGSAAAGHPPSVWLTDGKGEPRMVQVAKGSYRIEGLQPGRWRIDVGGVGYREAGEDLVLEAGDNQQDLPVERREELHVGVRWDSSFDESDFEWIHELVPVVTLAEPGEKLPFEARPRIRLGAGVFWPKEESPHYDAVGLLELDVLPPVHASLVLGSDVLETQLVAPGVEEIRFAPGPESLARFLCVARFSTPLPEEVGDGYSFLERLDREPTSWILRKDRAERRIRLRPGEYAVRVLARSRLVFERRFTAEAGEELDLGMLSGE